MKKKFLLAALLSLVLCGMAACGGDGTTPSGEDDKPVSIAVAGESFEIAAGEFDPADFSVEVTRESGKTETVTLTAEMLNAEQVAALASAGTYTLDVSYLGLTAQFTLTVSDRLGLVLYWEEDTGLLRMAIIGNPEGDYTKTGFAGFQIDLRFRGEFEGVTARLDGLQVSLREEGKLRLLWASAENIEGPTEIARLGFSQGGFSESDAEISLFDEEQNPVACRVYYGNTYWEEAEL